LPQDDVSEKQGTLGAYLYRVEGWGPRGNFYAW